MKKISKIISTLLVATLGCATVAACSKKDNTETAQSDYSYVTLRINPEVDLIADKNGEVLSAIPGNEDGEVVLSMVALEGLSIEEAGVEFTETASELGYFDENGETDTVYIGVEGDGELEEKLNKNIRDYFDNKGINGKVSRETLDKYADQAEEWALSKGHTKIVMRVLDAFPELTEEEVLNMTVKEWMELLKADKYVDKIAVSLQSDYRAAMQALKADHEELFTLRAELKTLIVSLKGEITDEEKSAIKAQISLLEDALKPLEKAFDDAAAEIRAQFKAASKDVRKTYRAEGEDRQKEFGDKKNK
ncbi:MAG: hypothetical protein IJY05_04045 [Clostridia bacterium]|nr:hypothetical protein [Clostridia bacterium]